MTLSPLPGCRQQPGPDPSSDQTWVLAAPFRAHLRRLLRETGLPWRALALQAGVEPTFVRALLHGRGGRPLRRIHPESAHLLLTLGPDDIHDLTRRHVPVGELPGQLRTLLLTGLEEGRLARCLRLQTHEVQALTAGSALYCTALTALLTEALWRARVPETLAA